MLPPGIPHYGFTFDARSPEEVQTYHVDESTWMTTNDKILSSSTRTGMGIQAESAGSTNDRNPDPNHNLNTLNGNGEPSTSRSFGGCVSCRRSKVKCGEERPACGRCSKRGTQCEYIPRPAHPTGRVRRHHLRSTSGCLTCRTRRVKCDEARPVCGPCLRRRCVCGFGEERMGRVDGVGEVICGLSNPVAGMRLKGTVQEPGRRSGLGQAGLTCKATGPSIAFRPEALANTTSGGPLPPDPAIPASLRMLSLPQPPGYALIPPDSRSIPLSWADPVSQGVNPVSGPPPASSSSAMLPETMYYSAPVESGSSVQGGCPSSAVWSSYPDYPDQRTTGDEWRRTDPRLSGLGPSGIRADFDPAGVWDKRIEPGRHLGKGKVEKEQQSLGSLGPGARFRIPSAAELDVVLKPGEAYAVGYHDVAHTLLPGKELRPPSGAWEQPNRELVIPYPSATMQVIDSHTIQGGWERDGEGRIRPIVIQSRADSVAVLPHPAVPFNSFPTAFINLMDRDPRSLGGMPISLLTQPVPGEVAMVKEIDPFSIFFPVDRDRVIYRHFTSETANSLIAMANRAELNPWTRHFAKLALGVPPGVCAAQDAFRQALLSLSSFDLGYRITIASGMSREQVHLNPIVKLSEDFRYGAKMMLDSLVEKQPGLFATSSDDLALAACLALSHRDRIAACRSWTYSLEYAADLINKLGGAETFLRSSYTMIRRFLMEQMACVDVFASFFTIDAPLILEPHAAWWEASYSSKAPRSLLEHVEIVYGLDKPMIEFLARVMNIVALGRHAAMRKAGIPSVRLARHSDEEVEDRWETYHGDCAELIREADQIGLETRSRPYPARIAIGRIMWQNAATIWLCADATNTKAKVARVYQAVQPLFETTIEALGQGMVTHLCLPFCFAAYFARGDDRRKVGRILTMLEPYSRMDWSTLNRYIRFVWELLDAPQQIVQLKNWRQLYDDADQFLPYI